MSRRGMAVLARKTPSSDFAQGEMDRRLRDVRVWEVVLTSSWRDSCEILRRELTVMVCVCRISDVWSLMRVVVERFRVREVKSWR